MLVCATPCNDGGDDGARGLGGDHPSGLSAPPCRAVPHLSADGAIHPQGEVLGENGLPRAAKLPSQ